MATQTGGSEKASRVRLVTKPSHDNISHIYGCLHSFLNYISMATRLPPTSLSLHAYVSSFVQDTYLLRLQHCMDDILAHTHKSHDLKRSLTNAHTQHAYKLPRPLFQSTVSVATFLDQVCQLTTHLPDHSSSLLNLLCKSLQDYLSHLQQLHTRLSQGDLEEHSLISAAWIKDPDINRFLQSLPTWMDLKRFEDISLSSPSSSSSPSSCLISEVDRRGMLAKESSVISSNIGDSGVGVNDILTDHAVLKHLGHLCESALWFSERIDELCANLESGNTCPKFLLSTPVKPRPPANQGVSMATNRKSIVSKDTLTTLKALARHFEDLSDSCLLLLHLEVPPSFPPSPLLLFLLSLPPFVPSSLLSLLLFILFLFLSSFLPSSFPSLFSLSSFSFSASHFPSSLLFLLILFLLLLISHSLFIHSFIFHKNSLKTTKTSNLTKYPPKPLKTPPNSPNPSKPPQTPQTPQNPPKPLKTPPNSPNPSKPPQTPQNPPKPLKTPPNSPNPSKPPQTPQNPPKLPKPLKTTPSSPNTSKPLLTPQTLRNHLKLPKTPQNPPKLPKTPQNPPNSPKPLRTPQTPQNPSEPPQTPQNPSEPPKLPKTPQNPPNSPKPLRTPQTPQNPSKPSQTPQNHPKSSQTPQNHPKLPKTTQVRMHCLHHLLRLPEGDFFCAIDRLEPDDHVTRLCKDLSHVEAALVHSLQVGGVVAMEFWWLL